MTPTATIYKAAPVEVMGWHFAAEKLRGGAPLPKKGAVLAFAGEVVACPNEDALARGAGGYHASERALDALQYAPGAMVARVRLSGTVVAHGSPVNKHAASCRKMLTDYVDATRVLHEFACWCATKALDRVEARGLKVDPRSRKAIDVKQAWLIGKATDEELAAARAAARDAAWAAAMAAARNAAMAAAWAATWDAAWAAAWAAARAAAMDAARNAARAAARAATWDATWDAARDEENTELERRLRELLGVAA